MFTVVTQFIYVALLTRCRHLEYNSDGDRPIKKNVRLFFCSRRVVDDAMQISKLW